MSKPVAKSLHTVTVLVKLAQYLMHHRIMNDPNDALDEALEVLDLDFKPDPYGLADAARKQLLAGATK